MLTSEVLCFDKMTSPTSMTSLTSFQSYDAEKLKEMIEDYKEWEMDMGVNHGDTDTTDEEIYPEFRLYPDEEDMSLFTKANVHLFSEEFIKEFGATFIGIMSFPSDESFLHTCGVIAQVYGVKSALVEAAAWILCVIRNDQRSVLGCDMEEYRSTLGLSQDAVCFVKKYEEVGLYRNFIKNIAGLARVLDI